MDSIECRVCSSSTRLPCDSYSSTQNLSVQIHNRQGDFLIMDYVSSLREEPYIDLIQNHLSDLATLWAQFGTSEKKKFYETYNNIAFLMLVPIEELLL